MCRKSCFRRPFESQVCKQCQILLKAAPTHLYLLFWALWMQLSWKKSVLVKSRILGLFANTLTADDKYSLLNRDNVNAVNSDSSIKVTKIFFSMLFLCFWNLYLILNIWKKKNTLIADVFGKLETAKDVLKEISKKSCSRRPFNKRHGKRSQTLLKSKKQHLYHLNDHCESNWVGRSLF